MDETRLNEQIKKLRTSKKLTLSTLAERLGVTISAVAAYENGTRNPSFDVLIKIARIFNVTIDNLLGYSNKDLMDVSDLSLSQRDNVQNLILTYRKFNLLISENFQLNKNDSNVEIDAYMYDDFETFRDSVKKKK